MTTMRQRRQVVNPSQSPSPTHDAETSSCDFRQQRAKKRPLSKNPSHTSWRMFVMVPICVLVVCMLAVLILGPGSSTSFVDYTDQPSLRPVASKFLSRPKVLNLEGFHEEEETGYQQQKDRHYGGLEIELLAPGASREIQFDPHWSLQPPESEVQTDDMDPYYAMDDDYIRSSYYIYDDDQIRDERRCRRPSWYRTNRPNCNSIHELDLANEVSWYIGKGGYHQVFVFNDTEMDMVWKQIGIQWDYDTECFEAVRLDALMMDSFADNPRFVDGYGFCGMAVISEYYENGDIGDWVTEAHQDGEEAIDPSDKLIVATEAAEAIAAMHGYKEGPIVHGDLTLYQLLLERTGKVVLNDFNRVEILLYDEENEEYCKYIGSGDTTRAPEEYLGIPFGEKADVFSFGDMLVHLLRGEEMEAEIETPEDFIEKVVEGVVHPIRATYANRSFAEQKLVEIMELCLEFDPDKRPDIFQALRLLRQAVEEDEHLRSSHVAETL